MGGKGLTQLSPTLQKFTPQTQQLTRKERVAIPSISRSPSKITSNVEATFILSLGVKVTHQNSNLEVRRDPNIISQDDIKVLLAWTWEALKT